MTRSSVGPRIPRRGNRLTRWLGRTVLAAMGWRLRGAVPDHPRLIAIGAPHTSNWDFVLVMATAFALGVEIHWLGKHTLFRPPTGWLMRRLGGIPVDRGVSSGVVARSAEEVRTREQMFLCIAPEGTRGLVRRWRTGFYHIAREAGVPILLCYLDNRRRTVGFGPVLTPSGDLAADMDSIRKFYRRFRGRRGATKESTARPA